MKKQSKLGFALLVLSLFFFSELSAQGLLKKATQKLQRDAEKMLLDDKDSKKQSTDNPVYMDDSGTDAGSYSGSNNSNSDRKKMTPPDVKKNIASAESAFKDEKYDQTRYATQQALLGVELEIGYDVLKALPEEISGNKSNEQDDHITSTGIGFAGLHIERDYNGDNQYINLKIINNAALLGMYSGMISTPGYADENQKSVMVGDYRGTLEASEGGYYNLGIPIGQSSLLEMEFSNFDDEKDVLSCAEKVDIAKIKELLGEQ